ncbi:MAG: RHS repeat-associated core domain-containing protein [Chlamydiota bacterium]
MQFFLILLTCFFSCVYGSSVAVTENDPSSIVNHVSVITGDVYWSEEDVVVQGVQPISFRRSYVSQKGMGYWSSLDCLQANLLHSGFMVVKESRGSTLSYFMTSKMNKKNVEYSFESLDLQNQAKGLTNTARGKISGLTNLKNQQLYMSSDLKEFSITRADGIKRIYKLKHEEKVKIFGNKVSIHNTYLLQKEEFPNGNKIIYEWPKKDKDVWQIRSCNPTEDITYAWIRFHPKIGVKDRSNADYGIETSDGRHFEYKYFEHTGFFLLKEVSSDEKPTETIHYLTCNGKKLLNAITWPSNRSIQFTYYTPGDYYQGSRLKENDPVCFRVKQILSPVSEEGHLVATHTFEYDCKNKKTTVLDAYNTPTIYRWDDDLHLTEINRFSAQGVPFNTEKFIWGSAGSKEASNLLCKVLLDAEGSPIRASSYSYDKWGNISQDQFYGNLTGHGTISLDGKGLPIHDDAECYTKQYKHSKDGKHLLYWQEEDNGGRTEYSYEGSLPLIKEERVFDKGSLIQCKNYEYNKYRTLAKEFNKDVLEGTLLITEITPRNSQNYIGLPEVIETKYDSNHGINLLKKIRLSYGPGGRVTQEDVFDSTGTFQYNVKNHYEKGLLVQETNALGRVATSKYDELQNKIYYKDFGSRAECRLSYDTANRLCWVIEKGEGLERITSKKYNFLNLEISSCDEYQNETTYEYDPFGHMLKMTLPEGEVTLRNYDAAGRPIYHTDAKGYTTYTKYNAYDKPVEISHSDGFYEYFTYYLDGTLQSHTDQNGIQTFYTYDSLGRVLSKQKAGLVESFTYNAFNLTSSTDLENHTTIFTFDGAGRKISEQLDDETVTYEYDSLGRLSKEYYGDLVTVTVFDILDRVKEVRKEDFKGTPLSKISYGYDLAGNQDSVTKYIQGARSSEIFNYDALCRPISHTNAIGKVTTYSHSLIPHQKTTMDPLGLQTIETYNSNGKIQSLEKRSGAGKTLSVDFYTYDDNLNLEYTTCRLDDRQVITHRSYGPLNRLECLTEGFETQDEKKTFYSYTPIGQIEKLEKPNGVILRSTYNDQDLLESQTSSDGTIYYTYTYDKNGNLIEGVNEHTKEKITRSYDAKGRVNLETFLDHLYVEKDYDSQGRKKYLGLPNGSGVRYQYDALHLRQVSRWFKDQCLYTHDYTSYDPLAGHLLEERLPFNLGAIARKYDLLERPISFQSPFFTQQAIKFDDVGNILSTNRAQKNLTYTYDDLYQLTSEENHTYRFDALHNRVMKDYLSSSINPLNQTSDLNYGKDGNPTSLNGKTLSYDALDRLITVEDASTRICYSYDVLHRRLLKTVYTLFEGNWNPIDTIYYLYDDQNEIGAFDSSKRAIELRILGSTSHAEIGSAIAIELNQKIYIPFHDLHGNVAALYSPEDLTLESYSYSAFGEEEFLPSIKNPWRFSSKRTDEETGLVYYGRRYYIPTLGRWLSQDPLGLEAGPNLYAFVLNDPLTHFDLYGLLEDGWFARSMEKARDAVAGVAHGTADFAIHSAGWTVDMAGSAMNHFGSSLLDFDASSREFSGMQRRASYEKSLNSINDNIIRGMNSLGVNTNSNFYQGARSGTTTALEISSCALGAYGATKGVIYGTRKAIQYTSTRFGKNVASRSSLWGSSAEASTLGYPATSSRSAHLLKNRLTAEEISGGHAFEKHVIQRNEFPGFSRFEFEQHLKKILNNPTEVKTLTSKRTGYWDRTSGTVIVRDPSAIDGGTAFRPIQGKKYYDDVLR